MSRDRLDQELRDLLLPLGVVPVESAFTVVCLYDKQDRQIWNLLSQHLLPLIAYYGESLSFQSQEVCNKHWLRSELERDQFEEQLRQAHLIVLGMSSNLVTTFYGEGTFLRKWLAALPAQPSSLLPVMLRGVSLNHIPLVMRRSLPHVRKAIASARDRDEVCVEIAGLLEQEIDITRGWYQKADSEE